METKEQAAEAYQEGMRKVDNDRTYDSIDVDAIRYVAFRAGAEWQKQKAIEAYCNSNHSFLCVLQGRNDFSCRESCKHIKEFINTL